MPRTLRRWQDAFGDRPLCPRGAKGGALGQRSLSAPCVTFKNQVRRQAAGLARLLSRLNRGHLHVEETRTYPACTRDRRGRHARRHRRRRDGPDAAARTALRQADRARPRVGRRQESGHLRGRLRGARHPRRIRLPGARARRRSDSAVRQTERRAGGAGHAAQRRTAARDAADLDPGRRRHRPAGVAARHRESGGPRHAQHARGGRRGHDRDLPRALRQQDRPAARAGASSKRWASACRSTRSTSTPSPR